MLDGKISILIVESAVDFGGSIVSTANLIRGMHRSRFEPTLVSSASEELVRSKLAEASESTVVAIARKALDYRRLDRIKSKLNSIPSAPVRRALIYLLYIVRLIVNLPYAWKIARLICARKVDLVQLNNGFGNDEVEFVCVLLKRPRIVFFRGYQLLSAIERKFLLPGVRAFVAVSAHVKAEAIADGVPAEKICVATPPAIIDYCSPAVRAATRSRYGVAPGDLVFGIFGRIVEWKGQREFLLAASLVLKQFPNAKAFIVGDISDGEASYAVEVNTLARTPGLLGHVIFTGYVERVYEIYSIMDVVVHMSIEPEPSGRVIFESMSCGVPVVASCYGGPREFIEDGYDGYICDPKQPAEVAQRICELLGDDSRRREMGYRAEAKVSKMYNKTVYAEAVQRVYLECLGLENKGHLGSTPS